MQHFHTLATSVGLITALLALSACGEHRFADPSREYAEPLPIDAPLHHVQIHSPKTLGVVDTPLLDINGTPIGVSCQTCHGPTPSAAMTRAPGAPETFHSGVTIKHGDLQCNFCHEPTDRTRLHLADGQTLEFDEVMTLCAQCHGVQTRDYRNGAHGGMSGYWDLKQGPRERNNCVDCHAPHAPAYGKYMPVHPPRDRFMAHEEAH